LFGQPARSGIRELHGVMGCYEIEEMALDILLGEEKYVSKFQK
jgi:hypothetical protein